MKRIVNSRFLLGLVLLVVVVLLFPVFFQIRPNIVWSGSMEPEIGVGSLAYVSKSYPVDAIEVGDVIAYEVSMGGCVLHRVTRINAQEHTFCTKGDANDSEDLGVVDFTQYRGRYIFSIPLAGFLLGAIFRRPVLLGLLGIYIARLFVSFNKKRQLEVCGAQKDKPPHIP